MLDKDVVKALEEHIENTKNIKYGARKVEVVNAELLKDTLDLINRQQADIDRLKNILDSYALQYGTVTDQRKKVNEIKAEAIKEFAERLTDRIADAMDRSHDNPNGSNYDLTDVYDTIAVVMKKMTEEQNNV